MSLREPVVPDEQKDVSLSGLDVYEVGGAVRDALLGLSAGDHDWVVVGARPEDLAARGFLPVGGDFPVFLHPRTKEEYALARTERKSGRGYKGFTFHTGPEVTLEEDLARRDLTVNAIARRPDGVLVDPYGGVADVQARLFRHVGPAFVEDPVRILRLARFCARFTDFRVADETLALAREMVRAGEVDALVPERVWKELSRGLMSRQPSRMLQVLQDTHALARIAPMLALDGTLGNWALLDRAAQAGLPLAGRYALLGRAASDVAALSRLWKVPAECADQARLLPVIVAAAAETGAGRLDALETCDALRKPERFLALLDAASLLVPVDVSAWRQALETVRGVDAGAIAAALSGQAQSIKTAVREARARALQALPQ
ncbi:CCA tRNA nucleotidyltransferase [Kerstersia similis]|uniref:CCA tRNA nucleotidyltransferase n=1 Tax=Kerstersia similis TaxID=206505 RepID=UPI0039EE225F